MHVTLIGSTSSNLTSPNHEDATC